MKYVALLRGINVGGKNKVPMSQLKLVFEAIGGTNVRTYINSGNVIFEHHESQAKLVRNIEKAIAQSFKFSVDIVVVSAERLQAIARELPDDWQNDSTMKCDVIFLRPDVDAPRVLDQLTIKPEIDTVRYLPGAILWSVERNLVTRSGLMKLAGSDLYKQVTIRNCNTLRKLAALCE